jgi:hypothetical protein
VSTPPSQPIIVWAQPWSKNFCGMPVTASTVNSVITIACSIRWIGSNLTTVSVVAFIGSP